MITVRCGRSGVHGHQQVGYGCPPGCSAAWLARLLWEQEVAGSNPAIPTSSGLVSGQLRSSLDKSYLIAAIGLFSWVGGIWEISFSSGCRRPPGTASGSAGVW
jgi:hypothetical protein